MYNLKKIAPSRRTKKIAYAIRDILCTAEERKRAGGDLIYLNIGDPVLFDFKTPDHLIEAAYKAMKDGYTGYSASEGVPEAIEAIREDTIKKGIKPYEILITTGASEAIDFALSALVNRGENVLVPSPGYPLYNALLARLMGEPRAYSLDEKNGWEPDIDHIESQIDKKTKAIVVINPNNPTGAVYSKEILQAIIEIARRHNLVILNDEIYDKLILNGQSHVNMAALDHEVPIVTFNGLSKSYLAPGFRVGWAIISGVPDLIRDYTEGMKKLARARLCASHPKQFAIPVALNGTLFHIDSTIEKLKRRRDITIERLNSIPGISCQRPNGAFYAFPRLEVDVNDAEFVKDLIRETGVVVVHGSGFGPLPKSPHFRLVFLPQEEILHKAYDRIEDFMKRRF
ncbi:aminotransferase class I/II-fold pyridoxal phosphate-dependent enzyme [Dissulfurimicrobium hydrothermale]|uniref:aminotransferase class I/II-fold pyridoxal phosphate-dependent enzyme n=1 Tax=Dissulfurimicrobium hydrothermale TaxID=1750598 RepID=UPI001EDB5550|nr:aminotransferase class I/II-fold pyridoxal phosphate-dependent enzyme [Dissulfurimicrobium hydrothermale]UKL13537.1 aminotransferase class I/II-fold pyridoxal phosphate-dependent enzyme [Dissulfurimicrobium hydrothermale]